MHAGGEKWSGSSAKAADLSSHIALLCKTESALLSCGGTTRLDIAFTSSNKSNLFKGTANTTKEDTCVIIF
jgi:hypothetical protein